MEAYKAMEYHLVMWLSVYLVSFGACSAAANSIWEFSGLTEEPFDSVLAVFRIQTAKIWPHFSLTYALILCAAATG